MPRPRSDPAAVALGLQLLDDGDPGGAVERSGVSLSTLYRAKRAAEDAPRAPPAVLHPALARAAPPAAAEAPLTPGELAQLRGLLRRLGAPAVG
jgi:hypothetical protein